MTFKWSTALIALLALALCCTLAAVSFAEKDDQDQKLTIEQLPPAVRATLEAQAQGNPIEDIEKETEDGVTFYSADIIQGDKKIGVEIAEDGSLLNSEPEAIDSEKEEGKCEENEVDEEEKEEGDNDVQVSLDQLPPAVQATLNQQAQGGTIGEIEKEDEDGAVVYEAEITKDGAEYDVKVAEDGSLINPKADNDDEESGDKEEEESEGDTD